MRKLILLICLVFVAAPAAAMASKPAHPTTPANTTATSNGKAKGSTATVLFVLRGTITGYTAGTSVQIKVASSNFESGALKSMTLSFPINSKTTVSGKVAANGKGTVKIRAAKTSNAAALQTLAAFQVIGHPAAA